MTEQKPLTADEETELRGMSEPRGVIGQLWATLDAERAKVAGMVDGIKHANDLLDEIPDGDAPSETWRELRAHLMGTNTDEHGKAYMTELDAERAEVERLREWRDAVSGAIKCLPEFAAGQWAGDKEGWGYHFEVVQWMIRELPRLRESNKELAAALANAHAVMARIRDNSQSIHWTQAGYMCKDACEVACAALAKATDGRDGAAQPTKGTTDDSV